MKIDLHCHSEASADCITPLPSILSRLRVTGISVQAITDHDQVWGAQKLKKLAGEERAAGESTPQIIVGEEVMTAEGEIIGLYLDERIEPGQSPEATVAEIRAQGGLVLLPHGFDPLKRYRLQPDATERLAEEFDIVEAFNARVSRPGWNEAAEQWAREREIAMSAGTDAHTLADVGSAYVTAPEHDILEPEDLLEALRAGSVEGHWRHPLAAFALKVSDWIAHQVRTRLGR